MSSLYLEIPTERKGDKSRNRKKSKGRKKGPQESSKKGEDITYMIGMKFDDEDEILAAFKEDDGSYARYSKVPEMKTLMDIFPDVPPAAIYAILEENFGNIELAAEELQAQADSLSHAHTHTRSATKTEAEVDKHYPRLGSKKYMTAAVTPPSPAMHSEWGHMSHPLQQQQQGPAFKLELTAAGLLNFKALLAKYKFVDDGVLHDIFITTGQSYTMTVLQLWDMFPDEMEAMGTSPPPSPPPQPPSSFNVPVLSTAHAKITKKPSGKSTSPTRENAQTARERPQRGSGGDNSNNYVLYSMDDFVGPMLEARKAIEGLKRNRNVTIAYKGGNVKTSVPAEEYGAKADKLFEKGVEEAARIGAEIIIRQKSFVDFHSLTVNETLGVLERLMEKLSERGHSHGVLMVTGLGKHSPDGRSHLMPAVEQWLSQRRICYTKKTGSVFVHL